MNIPVADPIQLNICDSSMILTPKDECNSYFVSFVSVERRISFSQVDLSI